MVFVYNVGISSQQLLTVLLSALDVANAGRPELQAGRKMGGNSDYTPLASTQSGNITCWKQCLWLRCPGKQSSVLTTVLKPAFFFQS